MEEKLRGERASQKTSLEAAAAREKEAALATLTVAKEREARMQQRSWEEDTSRLNAEIRRLQGQIEQEVAMQVSRSRLEFDQKLFENNRKHTTVCERYQEEYEKMKEEMEGRMNRLRAEHSEKVSRCCWISIRLSSRWRSWRLKSPTCYLGRWTWCSR